jgi:hypothetical protein
MVPVNLHGLVNADAVRSDPEGSSSRGVASTPWHGLALVRRQIRTRGCFQAPRASGCSRSFAACVRLRACRARSAPLVHAFDSRRLHCLPIVTCACCESVPTDVPASEWGSPPSWRSDRCFDERLSGLCSVPLRHLAQKISHCPAVRQRCRRTVAN